MIYELNELEFYRIKPMLIGSTVNLEIKAVANKFNPGWIFVDNYENPKSALVWSKGIEGFYFLGQETNIEFTECIDKYITEVIINRAKKVGLDRFEFSGTGVEWDQTLEKIFSNKELYKSKQFVYKYNNTEKTLIRKKDLPDGIEVKKVDKELLNSNVTNIDFVKSAILEWWNNVEDYINKGIGFCTIFDNNIVSSCISSFVTEESMESHIVTVEKYRKRGFAKIAVEEFLRYCIKYNYEPYWDCMESNAGSRALAESLGYYKDYEYKLYSFKI
ncbi:GNAT family N-acetyltransferase [Mobilitalea sibirica]|uniref:GNAT family N-acetyltransferase n=1 Tax=Mobilitalea sibirica TaxID=1462919 RepID=A0A8J7HBX9_9FIRM|nr:GNAT family N-acetyltransferase [Mobilitalea sibirica]MBH1939739.1 GNAT family N-acetyltransferase [Mobilitalea sibirica]